MEAYLPTLEVIGFSTIGLLHALGLGSLGLWAGRWALVHA